MKKRIVSMMLAAMMALSVVGCGSKTLSNDYVTVKQYKGLEVAQVEGEDRSGNKQQGRHGTHSASPKVNGFYRYS